MAQETKATLKQEALRLIGLGNNVYTSKPDSCAFYYQAAYEAYGKAEYRASQVAILNALAVLYSRNGHYGKYEEYSLRALQEADFYLGKTHSRYLEALINTSNIYFSQGNYPKSNALLLRAIAELDQERVVTLDRTTIYQNLSFNYNELGEYQKALHYQRLVRDTLEAQESIDIYRLSRIYNDLGWTFKAMSSLDSAKYYLQKGRQMIPVIPKDNRGQARNYITLHQNLTDVYLQMGATDAARELIEHLLLQQEQEATYRKAFSFELLAKVAAQEGDYTKGITAISQAIAIAKEDYKSSGFPKLSRKYLVAADLYEQVKQPEQALYFAEQAIQVLSPNREGLTDNELIDPSNLLAPLDALRAMLKKAAILNNLASTKGQDLLEESFQTYKHAVTIVQGLRMIGLSAKAKVTLQELTGELYENAIQNALQLHAVTNDSKYLYDAFRITEANKARTLVEDINASRASHLVNIPDSLINLETDLRQSIVFYNNQIAQEERASTPNTEVVARYQNLVREKEEQLQLLTNQIDEQFPRLKMLTEAKQLVSPTMLQQQLKEQQSTLISYFLGQDNIYAFVLNEIQISIDTITYPKGLAEHISLLHHTISSPPVSNFSEEAYSKFLNTTHHLYEQLLKAPLAKSKNSSLIIIPDNYLALIPFELLLSDLPSIAEQKQYFNQLPYLLRQYKISYDYSATLWSLNQEVPEHSFKGDFLGIAPAFSEGSSNQETRSCEGGFLSQLSCNQKEITQISNLLGGHTFTAEHANRTNFWANAANYKILHLATHACVDKEHPMLSKIYLSDDHLSIADLYDLELKNELVVLSACNTGSGKIIAGEGIMNLASGFFRAGCSSTLMSLWSVEDCSTAELMRLFYKNLDKGFRKDRALQEAKLAFMQSANKVQQHPFYWAAFVQYGNVNKLSIMPLSSFYILALVVGLVILIMIIRLRRSR